MARKKKKRAAKVPPETVQSANPTPTKDPDGLTPKQRQFVEEWPIDRNATAAAIRAGYSEKGATAEGSRLLANVKVRAVLDRVQAEMAERAKISQDWVIGKLKSNLVRAMQEVPVLDKEGQPTGEYNYQGAVANKAAELIGRHIGMWKEQHLAGPQVSVQVIVGIDEDKVLGNKPSDDDDSGTD